MNRDRILFFLYLGAVILWTSFHDLRLFGGAALLMAGLSGRAFFRLAKRTFFALLFFNSAVSISYLLLALGRGGGSLTPLVLINSRTALLTYTTFLMIDRVNLFAALAFSKNLTYLLVLSYSQILTFRKVLEELRLSLKSRTITRPGRRDLYRFISAAVYLFLDGALHNAKEIALAMRSRGFSHD